MRGSGLIGEGVEGKLLGRVQKIAGWEKKKPTFGLLLILRERAMKVATRFYSHTHGLGVRPPVRPSLVQLLLHAFPERKADAGHGLGRLVRERDLYTRSLQALSVFA